MNKKIAIIAANFTGNKGAAAMLKSIIKNLDSEYNGLTYNLLSVYPKNDRLENPFKNVKVISCKPQEIIFIGFSMAILFFLFKRLKPVRKFLLKYKMLKGLYEADLVVDAAGISFVDSRGFIMNTYNFICVATPLLLGKTIIKYSQAMGPFNSFWNRTLAKILLPKIHTICARGEITRFHLDKLNLKNITNVHIRFGRVHRDEDAPELLHERHRIFRRPQIRLGDDLHERSASAIEITIGLAAFMDQFTRIIFDVQPCDPTLLPLSVWNDAPMREGILILRNLVSGWEIGVEIILPVHVVILRDGAAERLARLYCFLQRHCIWHGERSGVPHAHRAHGPIWRFPESIIVASAEQLRLRIDLRMHFETDDCFVGDVRHKI